MEKNSDHYFDICIVGGGIAGNYLAHLLTQISSDKASRKNYKLKICVIEEHKEIGLPFQCAGIVSQKILKLTKIPPHLILNRVKEAHLFAPNGEKIQVIAQEHPVILDRIAFDKFFAQRAQNKGVLYYLSEKFLKFKRLDSEWVEVTTNKHVFHCHILVGADGPVSAVGRQLNRKNTLVPAAQVRARIQWPNYVTSMYFDQQWRELFGYVVPEGANGICRIGLACLRHTPKKLEIFCNKIGVKPHELLDRQGGILPINLPTRFVWNNVVLIGDAAGFVKATTGGGIIMILSAARILAPILLIALNKGDYSYHFLRWKYQIPVKLSIGIELKIHYLIRLFLLNLRTEDYRQLFHFYYLPKIRSMVYRDADMDFPAKVILKIVLTSEFWIWCVPIVLRKWRLLPYIIRALFT
ncbi:MAG: hypothetical protein ACTSUK_09475 [Promethearchaeota archaeon]